MGRRTKARRLDAWMNGEKVGEWILDAAGRQTFAYAPAWPASEFARPISLSMPIRTLPYQGPEVEAFFDNLLPDSPSIRKRLQNRFGAPSLQAFDLLAEIGRDCVGALQLLPADAEPEDPRAIRGEALGESQIADALRAASASLGPGREDPGEFRISLAGAQEKTAFLRHKGRWHRPIGATPTTHIFKLPMGDRIGKAGIDLSSSVEIEWLCGRLVAAFGIPVAKSTMEVFEDRKVLVVERFDRMLSPDKSWWIRLPQEDLCQALAVPTGRKYESEGAPGMGEILAFLLGSRDSQEDRRTFLKAQVLFWMLAAVDGHARNFSVFIGRRGEFRLTPLYDVISAYPVMGHGRNQLAPEKAKLAMSVRGGGKHYLWDRITRRHWRETASAHGMGSQIESILSELIEGAEPATGRVLDELPAGFPGKIAESIVTGLKKAAARLAAAG